MLSNSHMSTFSITLKLLVNHSANFISSLLALFSCLRRIARENPCMSTRFADFHIRRTLLAKQELMQRIVRMGQQSSAPRRQNLRRKQICKSLIKEQRILARLAFHSKGNSRMIWKLTYLSQQTIQHMLLFIVSRALELYKTCSTPKI